MKKRTQGQGHDIHKAEAEFLGRNEDLISLVKFALQ